ncbi:MAG: FapA family protein [Treponemataceae bacterium]|nr:FapA family protein [Treponemataceae bacterium]
MAGLVIRGDLELVLDPLEIEVALRFTPRSQGPQWGIEEIAKLLSERQIAPPPPSKKIEEVLFTLARAKGPTTETLLRGQSPEPPVPEQVQWLELPIPGELTPYVDAALEQAGAPVVYRIKTEKIKRETVVTKPGPLPFLPPKKEVVVTYDKKEIRERVFVDVMVQDRLYADKGTKVGTLIPAKPGKPGKSVFGKPIPVLENEKTNFLFGEGLRVERNEIYSDISGIIRIGDRWADVVPLPRHRWRVERGTDGVTLYLYFEPGLQELPLPDPATIKEAARAQGAVDKYLISDELIKNELHKALETGQALEAFPLTSYQEADARVEITPDGLRACLYLRKGMAGAPPLEPKRIGEVIRQSGVRLQDPQKVKTDILNFLKGPETELTDYLLAEGTAPTRGKDKEIKITVSPINEEEWQKKRERLQQWLANPLQKGLSLLFPPEEATIQAVVQKSSRVAQVVSAAPGTPGIDVYGRPIPPIPGNDPDIEYSPGLSLVKGELICDQSGLLLIKQIEQRYLFQILEYQDARISVQIREDGMEATLTLEKERGAGTPLTTEGVRQALSAAGIQRGIDGNVLGDLIKEALERGSAGPRVVARGEPAVPAGGVALVWQLPSLQQEGASIARKSIKVPVEKGQEVVHLIKTGEQGRAGFDVRGNVIEPEKGEGFAVKYDESFQALPFERGLRLIAGRSGELVFDGWTLTIRSQYVVPADVGPRTGNINFTGEIRIAGKVQSGFAVFGGADIYIGGPVEGALVSAGGKVVIQQGIIGGDRGVVRARKTIEVSFVERATLLAIENIVIKNGALGCNIKTNGKLNLLSERGVLVGGVCKARLGLDAMHVGSERGIRTEISFGQDYLIADQIEVLEREQEKVRQAIQELDKQIKHALDSGKSIDGLGAEKVRLLKLLEKYGMKLFTLREKFEEHFPSEIRIRGNIFPGVVMESHGRYYEVKQRRSQVVFFFNRETGRIQEKSLV